MIRAAIYGRLGGDPVERTTSGGKVMVTATVAVNAARFGADEITEWFGLAAFGKSAETLLRHRQGDLLAVMGVMSLRIYTDRNNVERQSWSLNCDSIVSARTVRPGGEKKRDTRTGGTVQHQEADGDSSMDDGLPESMGGRLV